MLNIISDFTKSILPSKRKTSPTGWISFNSVCCPHNGESADKRGRGGLTANGDGSVSYHCFNCGYKASYRPGRPLFFKFRKLLSWLGASDLDIKRMVIEAIRVRELVNPDEVKAERDEKIEFKYRSLPKDAISYSKMSTFLTIAGEDYTIPNDFLYQANYLVGRGIDLGAYEFFYTDDGNYKLNKRVIIPCTWEHKTIGYIARAVDDTVSPTYHNNYDSDYVFNVDKQKHNWKFVIVSEGAFDAMSVDGVAVLGKEITEKQADIIDSLSREVIVVPDFDVKVDEETGIKKWSGESLVDEALKYGWSVSFPIWMETCKDINQALQKYGKLFVVKSILEGKQSSKLKIELLRKRIV